MLHMKMHDLLAHCALLQVTAFGVVTANGQTGTMPTGMNFAFGGGETQVHGPVSPDSQLPSQSGGKASALGLQSSAAAPGGAAAGNASSTASPPEPQVLLLQRPSKCYLQWIN